jgi:hypothetical protein
MTTENTRPVRGIEAGGRPVSAFMMGAIRECYARVLCVSAMIDWLTTVRPIAAVEQINS